MSNPAAAPTPPFEPHGRTDGPLRAALQDDIALRHLGLAESVARSFSSFGPDAADIRQVAYLGLIKAVQRFNPARGVPFASFAIPTITGEIKRYLRDCCWVIRPPRHLQDLRTEAVRAAPVLAQRLGREPTTRELAEELGAEEPVVAEALTCSTSLRPESLDAPFDGKSWGDTLPSPDNCIERSDDLVSLRAAVNGLTAAEKELLYRRYFKEETQQQIGEHLGMTQMQVSRKLARILVLLQERLAGAAGSGSADIRIA
ncbi:sigma-70 family RNA polymerase sigma factor [Arthrobacter frigidicola]|nr:sigma-70 family RNA polymerase sigma factor [Arthrobacter frigidicola]